MTCAPPKMQAYVHGPITIRLIPYASSPLIFITSSTSNKFAHLFLLNNLLDANTASISKLFGDTERGRMYTPLLQELLANLLKRNSAVMQQQRGKDGMSTIGNESETWNRAVVSVAIKDKEVIVQAVEALKRLGR